MTQTPGRQIASEIHENLIGGHGGGHHSGWSVTETYDQQWWVLIHPDGGESMHRDFDQIAERIEDEIVAADEAEADRLAYLTDDELAAEHRSATRSRSGLSRLPAINAEVIRRAIETCPLPADPFAGLPR